MVRMMFYRIERNVLICHRPDRLRRIPAERPAGVKQTAMKSAQKSARAPSLQIARKSTGGGKLKRRVQYTSDDEDSIRSFSRRLGRPPCMRQLNFESPAHVRVPRRASTPESEAAQEREIIVISSDSESSTPSFEDDTPGLLSALGVLCIPARLHLDRTLPFLVRNVRQCFIAHCRSEGIAVSPPTVPEPVLKVTYRFRNENGEWEEYDGSTTSWRCPLCDLHGVFNTRDMMEYHVRADHDEVQSTWTTLFAADHEAVWSLVIQWTAAERDGVDPVRELPQLESAAAERIVLYVGTFPLSMSGLTYVRLPI